MDSSWILVLLLSNIITLIILGGALIWQREKLQETKKLVKKATKQLDEIESSASFSALIGQNSVITDTQNTLKEMIKALDKERKNNDELQSRLDIALTSAGMGVWEIEVESQAVTWSQQMYQIYEREPGEILTSDQWMEYIIIQDQGVVRDKMEKILKHPNQYQQLNYRIKTPKGQIKHIQSSFYIEVDVSNEPFRFIGVNQDITELVELEQMKNQLISMAAHELRSPLTSITWFTHLLKDELYDSMTDDHKDFLDEIEQGGTRMMHLIKDLLQFSRVEMGLNITDHNAQQVVDVNPIIEVAQKDSQNIIDNKSLTFHTFFEPDPLTVITHKDSLEIILENLISNAVKYSNTNGTVSCTAQVKARGEKFYYKTVKSEHGLCIRIADNGIGIPIEEQDKIYHKMYRGQKASKYHMYGTGVGLYMVRKVVQELGGKMWFTSKEGHGTVFFVIIPVK